MHKYNYDLFILLTSSIYKTIDLGKNEFRCLFVRIFGTLYRSLRSDNCFPYNILSGCVLSLRINFILFKMRRSHCVMTSSWFLPTSPPAVLISLSIRCLSCLKKLPPQHTRPKVIVLLTIDE